MLHVVPPSSWSKAPHPLREKAPHLRPQDVIVRQLRPRAENKPAQRMRPVAFRTTGIVELLDGPCSVAHPVPAKPLFPPKRTRVRHQNLVFDQFGIRRGLYILVGCAYNSRKYHGHCTTCLYGPRPVLGGPGREALHIARRAVRCWVSHMKRASSSVDKILHRLFLLRTTFSQSQSCPPCRHLPITVKPRRIRYTFIP